MMVQSDCGLNQPLQKSLLGAGRFTPNVLPDFVGVIEFRGIKQMNAALVSVRVHRGSPSVVIVAFHAK